MVAACSSNSGDQIGVGKFQAISEQERVTLLGTEPFWSVEVVGSELVYSSPDNPDGMRTQISRFNGNNGLGLSGSLDGKELVIAVTPGECSDQMSDRSYPFTATVQIGDKQLQGCGYSDNNPFEGAQNP